jgi:hypothetical protein
MAKTRQQTLFDGQPVRSTAFKVTGAIKDDTAERLQLGDAVEITVSSHVEQIVHYRNEAGELVRQYVLKADTAKIG